MLKNTFMIDYLICHTFISEATQFISKLIKKYNHMHVIFNNITTKWLVVYRECSHSSDENLMFVMCSGVARRATWAAAPRFHGFNIESEFLSLVLHGLKTAESRNNLIVANLVLRKQSWVAIFCKTPPNPLDKEATREHEHGMVKVVECLQGVHGFKTQADCQWALLPPSDVNGFVSGKIWAIAVGSHVRCAWGGEATAECSIVQGGTR